MRTLRDTTIARIRELRQARGMTQQDLADRLNLNGARIDRTAVAKIEKGRRELTLAEAFMFAVALSVAPVHLFVPTDDDEPIMLTPTRGSTPEGMRAWIRGESPIGDPRAYFSTVPSDEFNAGRARYVETMTEAKWVGSGEEPDWAESWPDRGGISRRTSDEEENR
jgi:transcriptional regulator with XRE-family HTH domain